VYSRGGSPSLAREGPSQLISLSKVPTSRVLIIYLQLRISRGALALCHADVYLLLSHYCLLRSSPSSASPLSATFAYIPSGHRPGEDPDCSGGLLRRLFGSITDSPPRRTRGSRQRAFSVPLPARATFSPSFLPSFLPFVCFSSDVSLFLFPFVPSLSSLFLFSRCLLFPCYHPSFSSPFVPASLTSRLMSKNVAISSPPPRLTRQCARYAARDGQ